MWQVSVCSVAATMPFLVYGVSTVPVIFWVKVIRNPVISFCMALGSMASVSQLGLAAVTLTPMSNEKKRCSPCSFLFSFACFYHWGEGDKKGGGGYLVCTRSYTPPLPPPRHFSAFSVSYICFVRHCLLGCVPRLLRSELLPSFAGRLELHKLFSYGRSQLSCLICTVVLCRQREPVYVKGEEPPRSVFWVSSCSKNSTVSRIHTTVICKSVSLE